MNGILRTYTDVSISLYVCPHVHTFHCSYGRIRIYISSIKVALTKNMYYFVCPYHSFVCELPVMYPTFKNSVSADLKWISEVPYQP